VQQLHVLDMLVALLFFTLGPQCWSVEMVLAHGLLHTAYSLDPHQLVNCLTILQRIASSTITPPDNIDHCSRCNYRCTLAMTAQFCCAACGLLQSAPLLLLEGQIGQAAVLQQLLLHIFHAGRLCWINLPRNISIPSKVRSDLSDACF
jgi:hypothetical protein